MKTELATQVVDMSVKVTPPVAVSGLSIAGLPLPEVIQIGTIVYLVVMITYTLHKWYKGR